MTTGAFKGALGIALLTVLPIVGYGLIVTQTVVFLYESVGKLVSAYPARRSVGGRRANRLLHASIVLGIALQALTVLVPALRRFLGLEPLGGRVALLLIAAIVATWAFAALMSRTVGHGRRPPQAGRRGVAGRASTPSLRHAPAR